jgi:hypothetical protein
MKGIACYYFCVLAVIAGFASLALSQTAPAGSNGSQGVGQGALNQVRGFAGGGTRVTVHIIDAVDSTRPANGQFRGTVKNAVALGTLEVPAGANAVVKLVNGGAAGMWTVALTSVTAGGQAVAVTGGSPSLGAGSVTASAASAVQNKLSGLLGRSPKTQPATTPLTPSVAGTRVYLPAGSEVVFSVAASASAAVPGTAQTAGTQQIAVAPAAVAPAAAAPPPGSQPAAAQPVATQAGPGAGTVVYENIQYQLQGCQHQAPHIICQIQITNLRASDAFLNGGQGSYYVDQAGNKVGTSMRAIANCAGFGRCQLLPGVAMAGRFEFVDEDGHATQLIRLQIQLSGKAVAQFTNVPVQ